ncbi:MAG: hypothetical protein HFE82_07575 [Erysipelotrichaceae bacterium]|nr:hypothetical protein [Erysipelotrichaceae bacterium]
MSNKKDTEDGVWRTVGGRRIFIRNGVDLPTAMRESGKFDNVIKETPSRKYNSDVSFICKIRGIYEIEKEYGKLKNHDVVLTDERKQHIIKRRGSDADDVNQHIGDTIKEYDYIIVGGKNSVRYLKSFSGKENYNVIVILSLNDSKYANSITTGMKISDKRLERYLKSNKIIAKRRK